jgi:hypothetical protein
MSWGKTLVKNRRKNMDRDRYLVTDLNIGHFLYLTCYYLLMIFKMRMNIIEDMRLYLRIRVDVDVLNYQSPYKQIKLFITKKPDKIRYKNGQI